MRYWINTGDVVTGPFSLKQIRDFVDMRLMPETVLISKSKSGPWVQRNISSTGRSDLDLPDAVTMASGNKTQSRRSPSTSTNEPRCPKCSSSSIGAGPRGFDSGAALAGVVGFGLAGGLVGSLGQNRVKAWCAGCGHTWDPAEVASTRRAAERRIRDRKRKDRRREEIENQGGAIVDFRGTCYAMYMTATAVAFGGTTYFLLGLWPAILCGMVTFFVPGLPLGEACWRYRHLNIYRTVFNLAFYTMALTGFLALLGLLYFFYWTFTTDHAAYRP